MFKLVYDVVCDDLMILQNVTYYPTLANSENVVNAINELIAFCLEKKMVLTHVEVVKK